MCFVQDNDLGVESSDHRSPGAHDRGAGSDQPQRLSQLLTTQHRLDPFDPAGDTAASSTQRPMPQPNNQMRCADQPPHQQHIRSDLLSLHTPPN